jgi:hypothetical protein
MTAEGKGGRGGSNLQFSDSVLDGVRSENVYVELLRPQRCANPRCGRVFRPRAMGDNYCGEACDTDNYPEPE